MIILWFLTAPFLSRCTFDIAVTLHFLNQIQSISYVWRIEGHHKPIFMKIATYVCATFCIIYLCQLSLAENPGKSFTFQ